jgi:hypothetical protein
MAPGANWATFAVGLSSLILGIQINLRYLLKVFELAVNQIGLEVLLCEPTCAREVAGSHLGQITSFPVLRF